MGTGDGTGRVHSSGSGDGIGRVNGRGSGDGNGSGDVCMYVSSTSIDQPTSMLRCDDYAIFVEVAVDTSEM